MFIDKEVVVRALEFLRPEDFYREAHRHLFAAAQAIFERGGAVDLVTMTEELRTREVLEAVGGIAYVAGLAHGVPTSANADHYAAIVREKAMLRAMIAAAAEIGGRAYDPGEDPPKLLDDAERMIFEVARRRDAHSYYSMREVLAATLDRLEAVHGRGDALSGLSTGLGDFDLLTSGLQAADLIIVAARPSAGKSTLLLQIARFVATGKTKTPVALFSLEMSKEQLGLRFLSAEAKIDAQRARDGFLTEADWRSVSDAIARLSNAPIYIDDSATLSVMDLRTKARRIQAEQGLGLVIVDYLQLMHSRSRVENRQQEIAEISRLLKALARELGVPVIAASQLSRAIEQRQDRRPLLSDLRESGSIEQDADLVCFIHRDRNEGNPNQCEIIIAKQRNGPTGSVFALFQREIGHFQPVPRPEG
jgi:replicative DNA helicase